MKESLKRIALMLPVATLASQAIANEINLPTPTIYSPRTEQKVSYSVHGLYAQVSAGQTIETSDSRDAIAFKVTGIDNTRADISWVEAKATATASAASAYAFLHVAEGSYPYYNICTIRSTMSATAYGAGNQAVGYYAQSGAMLAGCVMQNNTTVGSYTPANFTNSKIDVTGYDGAQAIGMYGGYLYIDFNTSNSISAQSEGGSATGIYVYDQGNGNFIDKISGGTISARVTSSTGNASIATGIYLKDGTVRNGITGGTLRATNDGANANDTAAALYLDGDSSVSVINNADIGTVVNGGDAFGIYLKSNGADKSPSIGNIDGTISATSTNGNSYGIYNSSGGSLGQIQANISAVSTNGDSWGIYHADTSELNLMDGTSISADIAIASNGNITFSNASGTEQGISVEGGITGINNNITMTVQSGLNVNVKDVSSGNGDISLNNSGNLTVDGSTAQSSDRINASFANINNTGTLNVIGHAQLNVGSNLSSDGAIKLGKNSALNLGYGTNTINGTVHLQAGSQIAGNGWVEIGGSAEYTLDLAGGDISTDSGTNSVDLSSYFGADFDFTGSNSLTLNLDTAFVAGLELAGINLSKGMTFTINLGDNIAQLTKEGISLKNNTEDMNWSAGEWDSDSQSLTLTFENYISPDLTVTEVFYNKVADTWSFTMDNASYDILESTGRGNIIFDETAMAEFVNLRDENSGLTWMEIITIYNEDGESITITDNLDFDLNDITINGTVYTGNGYMLAEIPEPTTVTLSLLALASLGARRRRKAA